MSLNFSESIVNRNSAAIRGTPPRRREYIQRDAQIQRNLADFARGLITRFELLERLVQYFDFHDAPNLLVCCDNFYDYNSQFICIITFFSVKK